jgi:hypothetical protein
MHAPLQRLYPPIRLLLITHRLQSRAAFSNTHHLHSGPERRRIEEVYFCSSIALYLILVKCILGMGILNHNVRLTSKMDGCTAGRAVEAQGGLDVDIERHGSHSGGGHSS